MKRIITVVVLLVGLVSVMSVLAQDGGQIEVEAVGVYPEGIATDGTDFYVGSPSGGAIYKVTQSGEIELFAENEDLVAILGVHVDSVNNQLVVANSDPGVSAKSSEATTGQLASLVRFDLATGEMLDFINLGELAPGIPHFANDFVFDDAGNIYVTDSFSPIIYRVSPEGEAEIFLQDDRFLGDGFNLNGIVYHPDGYLLVAKYNEGVLFKIPVENPADFTTVELDTELFGADGLVLQEDGTLVVVTNNILTGEPGNVYFITSDDDWTSAQVVSVVSTADQGTTATELDGAVYVLFGQMDKLFDPTNETPAEFFTIDLIETVTE